MKKICLTLAVVLLSYLTFAQTNTFPTNGDVTLGTQGYFGNSLIFQGWGEAPFIRSESIGNSVNGNTRLRMYLTDDWSYDQGFEIISNRWDGATRSLLYIPGNGGQATFYSGASFGDNVGIGTTDTKGYKLAVNGAAIATSMKVKLQANWPDFVFLKDYKLPTLTEVKTYIDKNQHLPDMPSADEVHKNGLDLGEMNRLLLKKVEELTLYLIEKDAQIEKLKTDQQEQINSQKAQLEEFRKELSKQKNN